MPLDADTNFDAIIQIEASCQLSEGYRNGQGGLKVPKIVDNVGYEDEMIDRVVTEW